MKKSTIRFEYSKNPGDITPDISIVNEHGAATRIPVSSFTATPDGYTLTIAVVNGDPRVGVEHIVKE